MTETEQRALEALRLRDELNATRFTRRELSRMGLLAGSAFFGVRGLSLPEKRMVSVTVDRPDVQEIDVGPWLRDVRLDHADLVERLSRSRESVLVGLAGVTSLASLKGRDVALPSVLPGSYLLVTQQGFFAHVDIDARGAVRVVRD